MEKYIIVAQLTIALSVAYVWIFRFDNVAKEFKQFGLSDFMRSLVAATKIALATLLIVSIWYPALVLIPTALMGFYMIVAQYFHFKVNNPMVKRLPSLFLLILCAIVVATAV
jgi:hypothetical protein